MANFSIKNEGTFFYFDPSNEELGGVCLRELSVDESNNITKKTTTKTRKPIRGQLVDVKEVDEDLAQKLTFQYCIISWEKVELDGEPIECNAIGKTKLMRSLDFVKFVSACLEQLTEKNATIEQARSEAQKEALKNGLDGNSQK